MTTASRKRGATSNLLDVNSSVTLSHESLLELLLPAQCLQSLKAGSVGVHWRGTTSADTHKSFVITSSVSSIGGGAATGDTVLGDISFHVLLRKKVQTLTSENKRAVEHVLNSFGVLRLELLNLGDHHARFTSVHPSEAHV